MIEIELIGSWTARHGEEVITTSRKGPVSPLARQLIASGFDADSLVRVVRRWGGEGPRPVYKNDRTLAAWAAEDWAESNSRGPHRVEYRSFGSREAIYGGSRGSPVLDSGETGNAQKTAMGGEEE
jgi:hypothetical protein